MDVSKERDIRRDDKKAGTPVIAGTPAKAGMPAIAGTPATAGKPATAREPTTAGTTAAAVTKKGRRKKLETSGRIQGRQHLQE